MCGKLQFSTDDKLSSILKQELCSASWRGYKATWQLRDGFLWLRNMRKNPCGKFEEVEVKQLFKAGEYPIKADWYTGKIILPVGDTKYIMRDGYDENNVKEGDFLGYDLEAFVFNFVEGRLESKGEELIQNRLDF